MVPGEHCAWGCLGGVTKTEFGPGLGQSLGSAHLRLPWREVGVESGMGWGKFLGEMCLRPPWRDEAGPFQAKGVPGEHSAQGSLGRVAEAGSGQAQGSPWWVLHSNLPWKDAWGWSWSSMVWEEAWEDSNKEACWHLWPQRVLQHFSAHLVEALGLVNEFFSIQSMYPVNCCFFFCVPGWVGLCLGPSVISLPTAGHSTGAGGWFPWISCLHLFYLFLCGPSMCCSYSISPGLSFRWNCSTCRCRFSVSMGWGELRVFLGHHLALPSSSLLIRIPVILDWGSS